MTATASLQRLRRLLEEDGDDPEISAAAEAAMGKILDGLPPDARAWFERRFEAVIRAADELGPAATAEEITGRARELEKRST